MLGLDNGVARRWLHGGAWVAALMAGRRAGSRAKGRAVPFIGKGGGGGQAGTQRPGEGLAREGDGEVAGLRDAVGGVSRRGVAGARGVRRRRQGGEVLAQPVGAGWYWPGARRVAGQVAAPAYGRRRRRGAGRREVGEAVSGSFVIFSKSKNQFCKFNFSPSSWLQMKKC